MSAFADWLLALVKAFFLAIWDFFSDLFISILEMLLTAISALLMAIPVPSFMTTGIQDAFNQISPEVWFFANHFKFPACFAILGAAVLFRLTRKFLTLFQW